MLGGNCSSLSAEGLLSTRLWNKQDVYQCPKCTHHLLPVTLFLILDLSCRASSAALSRALMCRCPITAALTSLRQRDCQWHWGCVGGGGGGLMLGQMILGRQHPHISLAITPTSPLLANFLPAEVGPLLILSVGRGSFSPIASPCPG